MNKYNPETFDLDFVVRFPPPPQVLQLGGPFPCKNKVD